MSKSRKYIFIGIIIFMILSGLSDIQTGLTLGFSDPDSPSATKTIEVKDDLERTVLINSPVEKIISLAPNVTEILFAIGAGKKIRGITSYCNYPHEVNEIRRVGDFSNPSIETILAIKPELVFLTSHEQAGLLSKLETLGIKTFVVYPKNIDELCSIIIQMGRVLGLEMKAVELVNSMKAEIHGIKKETDVIPEVKRVKVFMEILPSPLMTVSGESFESQLIEAAGGVNIAGELPRLYCRVNQEFVIEKKPDIIVLTHQVSSAEEVKKRMGWGEIPAVKNGRICDNINPDILIRPGPRIVEGIKMLNHFFYPEHIKHEENVKSDG